MMQKIRVLEDLARLKHLTQARIGLQRAGSSVGSQQILHFDLDHAKARDAVHLPFQSETLIQKLEEAGFASQKLHSAAPDRLTYLQRPDLGRKLSHASREAMSDMLQQTDICMVVGDGLSSTAIHENAFPFLQVLLPKLKHMALDVSPIYVAHQSRVALADEIGEIHQAKISVILIGERPGLSSANSMGIYLTYAPKVGRTDAERNCISNIRDGGLSYQMASDQLVQLIQGAMQKKLSGVDLKMTATQHSPVEDSWQSRLNDCDS